MAPLSSFGLHPFSYSPISSHTYSLTPLSAAAETTAAPAMSSDEEEIADLEADLEAEWRRVDDSLRGMTPDADSNGINVTGVVSTGAPATDDADIDDNVTNTSALIDETAPSVESETSSSDEEIDASYANDSSSASSSSSSSSSSSLVDAPLTTLIPEGRNALFSFFRFF